MRILVLAIVALIALPLAASISGTVIDPDGLPIAGVRIMANRVETPVGSMTTDANGTFELDAGDGFFELVAEKDGYALERLKVPGDERALSIVLVKRIGEPRPVFPKNESAQPAGGETITGIVRDEAKRPIEGIEVTVRKDNWYTFATTGAKGELVVNVPPGDYSLRVERSDYLYSETARVRSGGTCELIAKRTPSVDGVVVDYDGGPIRGARVELAADPTLQTLTPSVVTDATGRFRLRLRPDRWGRLIARKPGLPTTSLLLPDLEKARHGITLKFPRGIDLKGIVTSEDRRPVGGASINQDGAARMFIYSASGALQIEDWARTANDGTFSVRIEELPVDLLFAKDRYVATKVSIDHARSIRSLDVRLKQLQIVRGKLVRKDGTAVGGAIINAPDSPTSPTTTAEDGSFELPFPTAGEHVVEEGLVNRHQTVRAPAVDVRLIYDEGLTISGRVIDEVTGAPVEGTIELTSESSSLPIVPSSPVAGSFSFAGFEPEMVTISVSAAGYASAKVKVDAGQMQPIIIALEHDVTLRGRVHDADGKPLDEAVIRGEEQLGESDRDGRFEVKGFAPNVPATVTILKFGYISRSITIAPEELGKLADILLPAAFTMRGRILAPDGKPAAVGKVTARSTAHDAAVEYGASDANGQFEIKGLSAARYDFVVDEEEKSDLSGSSRDVDVEQVHEITIQLHHSASGVVTGRAIGIPASFTRRTIAVDGVGKAKLMNPDGTFRVERVPAGPTTVSATIGNLSGRTRTVSKAIEVPAGGEASVELVFGTQRVLTGRVTHRGRPVSGARLTFQGSSPLSAVADSDGRYDERLEPGRYSIEVADRDYQPMPFRGEVDVEQTSRYDISIDTSEIRVHVFDDETGRPLRNAGVTFANSADDTEINHTTTAADGVAVLEVALGTKGLVWVYEEGYAVAVVKTDDAEITVRLVRAVDLKVRVVDARDGRTLDACVTAYDLGGRVVASSAKPEPDGTASLNLRPGTHRVMASAEGYGSTTVRADAPSSELRIALQRGGTLVLRSNAELHGTVGILKSNGEIYASRCEYAGTIQLNGRITTINDIAPGSYTIEVTPSGGKPRRYPVTIIGGAVVPVQID